MLSVDQAGGSVGRVRPDVSVTIVNTNNRPVLRECLASLFASVGGGLSMEVFVVDNASTDGSVEMLREEFPTVRVLRNAVREGFSANHNKALHEASGRYALVLNDDTVIHAGAIEALVAFADQHPEAGIVGPLTLNPDGTVQDTCARFPSLARRARSLLFARFSSYCLDAYSPAFHAEGGDAEWIRGSCLLVRRSAMENVGLLDDRFFIFFEEVDWCYRMRLRGWRNLLCAGATIVHIGKSTVRRPGPGSIGMAAQMTLSERLYVEKHLGAVRRIAWRGLILLHLAGRLAKAYVPGTGGRAETLFRRRLLRHSFWLWTCSPTQLQHLTRVPGGLRS